MFTPKKIKSPFFRILFLIVIIMILFLDVLATPKFIIKEGDPQLALLNFLIQVAIMIALSMLLAPKPKQPKKLKPVSLEQFDIPTAEEGRPVQVLFGKKYVAAPNVVWYGHLKTVQVWG